MRNKTYVRILNLENEDSNCRFDVLVANVDESEMNLTNLIGTVLNKVFEEDSVRVDHGKKEDVRVTYAVSANKNMWSDKLQLATTLLNGVIGGVFEIDSREFDFILFLHKYTRNTCICGVNGSYRDVLERVDNV